jgi:hypothetical protein
MILLNGSTTIMAASGLSEDIGIELAPGVNDAMQNVVDDMKKGFSPDIGVIESLISMLTAGLNLFKVVVEGLYAAPSMFINLGFPAWAVNVLMAPLYLISTLEMMFIATGRDMV